MSADDNDINIQTLRWEIAAHSEPCAREWQETVSGFSRDGMVSFLNSFMEQQREPGENMLIERMEVELPVLTSPEDLNDVFREAFQKAWEDIKGSRTLIEGNGELSGTAQRQALGQLQFYLERGYLSWGSRVQDFEAATYFFGLIRKIPPTLVAEWLQAVLANANAARRLVHFFDPDQVLAIVELIRGEIAVLQRALATIAVAEVARRRNADRIMALEVILPIYYRNPDTTVADLLQAFWTRYPLSMEERKMLADRLVTDDTFRHLDGSPGGISSADAMDSIREALQLQECEHGNSVNDESEFLSDTKVHPPIKAESYFVENAGVVLFYPYLKLLLTNQGLVDQDQKFKSWEDQIKCCYLLQYLVSHDINIKEYQLVLNKVLMGVPIDSPITRMWGKGDADEEMYVRFVRAVIDNWPGVKGTSIEGFQNSFLLRKGKLEEEEHSWLLRIERKGWDVLLERLPYPLSVIRLPWMIKPLYVQW
ncbi:MAG TPA: contractile injection system tape measure protein [Cyclobacteriaceae bacterium]|nr:contractile injection system tape measure protein [Cyclobacteriaceae bacterium]